jgi:hypothetical protein
MEDFLKALQKDPSLISKLQKREGFTEFKEKYNVERATPLKCPVCSTFFQFPGSLWIDKVDHTKFVCKKCKLEFNLTCLTVPNDNLIEELRKIAKGEQKGMPSWYPQRTRI